MGEGEFISQYNEQMQVNFSKSFSIKKNRNIFNQGKCFIHIDFRHAHFFKSHSSKGLQPRLWGRNPLSKQLTSTEPAPAPAPKTLLNLKKQIFEYLLMCTRLIAVVIVYEQCVRVNAYVYVYVCMHMYTCVCICVRIRLRLVTADYAYKMVYNFFLKLLKFLC